MDEKILIPKEEFERLKASFNRFSDESNLRKQAEEKLKTANNKLAEQHRTEEQLRLLIDLQDAILNNAAYMVISTDCKGTITSFNRAAERALGYTAEKCIGKLTPITFHDINEVAERARLFSAELGTPVEPGFEVFAAKARLNLPNEYEWTYIRKDGSRFPVLLSVTALYGQQGNITGFLGIANDITERKQTEVALKKSEAQLNEAQHIAHIGSWELDVVNDILSWSDEIYRMFEINPEKFGASYEAFLNAIHPDDRDAVNLAYTNSLKTRIPYEIDHRLLFADGRIKYVHEQCESFYDADGKPNRSIGIVTDITERKQSEQKINQLAAIVESSDDAIIGKTLEGIVTSWNKGAEKIYGYTEGKMIGKSISVLLPPESANDISFILEKISKGEHIKHYETVRQRKDGRHIHVSLTISPIVDAGGKIIGASTIGRDITERKQSEEALRESEESYRMVFENSPVSIWEEDFSGVKILLDGLKKDGVTDLETYLSLHPETIRECADLVKIVDVNQAALSLHGAISKEELFAGLVNTFTPESFDTFRKELVCLWNGCTEMTIDAAVKTLAGERRSVTVYFSVCPGYGESLSKVFVSLVDITDRKHAEEALQKSEALLNITQRLSRVGGWEFDVQSGKSFWTEEVYQIHEMSADSDMDHFQESLECYSPEDRSIINDAFRGAVEKGESYDLEFPFTTYKGKPLWIRTTAQPVYEKGKVVRIIGNIMDITERKQAEESREKERKRMEVLLSSLNTGLSLINPDMTIAWVNQKIREMFPGKEPVGQVCHVFYESRETVCDGCGTQQAFVNGKVIESEQFVPSTGRWYYIISQPIKDPTGRVVNVLEGITDITERKEAEQKLKLLNFALNNVYDEAYLINEQACFNYVNDESCKALGYSYEELLGMNVAEVDPDFPLELWAQHWSDLKEHSSIIFESHHKTRDGRIYPVEISANYFEYNGQGYNLAMVRDITERKQSEEELAKHRNHLEALVAERTKQLQESEFYYRRLFETMFQGVVYQDAEGKVISMNPAAELILGKTQSEFLGKTSIYTENQTFKEDGSLFSDEEHPATRALNTGHEVQNVVMKLYNPAVKGYRWINLSAMPLFHPDETKPYQVYTLFNDITESKAAEEALRINEERMRLFFERQLVGMAITSPEKGWIKVNDKICEMLGYSSEELTRLTWSEMTYPEDLAPDVAQFERLLHDEIDGYTLEKRFVRKDGSIVFTNLLVGCVRRPDRSVDYVLAILENITGRKQADEQIQQLNEQLAARAQSLEIANKELEAFSYSVSHDLRAPLRSIDGFSLILLEEYQNKLDEQGKNYLRRVRSASQRMAQLIDDMLNLSRVSRGELNIRQVNLSEIAKEVADELRHNQPERAVEFIIQKGIQAQGDPRLLRIVLENLIENAWKFTSKHASARIEFGMMLQNNLRVYFIRDDGAGFDMNYAQKLFGAFQRLHTVDEFQGTGIGLATVQRVIHRHGGKVWAEGEVEKGATIYFTIA